MLMHCNYNTSLNIGYCFTNAIECSMLVLVPASYGKGYTPFKKLLHLT
jgi:hypothetical protein